jgi:pSer/pThr/pTyr-binding forkhead associated (FHA) protein
MNSTNGTYIDDERIHGTADLEVGSTLRVGDVSFVYEVRTRAEV